MRLLLLSNSTNPGEPYLAWSRPHIAEFLGREVRRVLFVPFAGVRMTSSEYTDAVRKALGPLGCEITGAHETADPVAALGESDAVAVGGGNTFRLLARLQETGMIETIRHRVHSGMPYVGWSAGANVACPTISTTNDMPIVEPRSFAALGLVPFQINPHYTDAALPNHGGETRPQRIAEYLELNREAEVVGLPEGTGLRVENGSVTAFGPHPVTIFRYGRAAVTAAPGQLLDLRAGVPI